MTDSQAVKSYVRSIWLRVIFASIMLFLMGGLVFGYGAIKPDLIKWGVFRDMCPEQSPPRASASASASFGADGVIGAAGLQLWPSPAGSLVGNSTDGAACDAQDIHLNSLIQVATGGVNLLAVPISRAADRLGRQRNTLVSGILVAGGLAGFAAASPPGAMPQWMHMWLLPLTWLAFTCAGNFLWLAAMHYMYDISKLRPTHAIWVNSTLSASWQTGSAVFSLMHAVLAALPSMSVQTMLYYYSAIGVPLVAFYFFITPPPQPPKQLSAGVPEDDAALVDVAIADLDVPEPTLSQVLFTPHVRALWFAGGMAMLACNFYVSTNFDQSTWLCEGDKAKADELTSWFAIILSVLGFLCSFAIGPLLSPKFEGEMVMWRGWRALAVVTPVWGALSVLKMLPFRAQYITYFFFAQWRTCFFVITFGYIGENWPSTQFSLVSMSTMAIGGVTTLLSIPLNILILKLGSDTYLPVNLVLNALATVSLAWLFVVARRLALVHNSAHAPSATTTSLLSSVASDAAFASASASSRLAAGGAAGTDSDGLGARRISSTQLMAKRPSGAHERSGLLHSHSLQRD